MAEKLAITQTCPQCGQVLMNIGTDGISDFRPCEHFAWSVDLGDVGKDEVHMFVIQSEIKLILWKR